MEIRIRPAIFPQDKNTVTTLFLAYAGSLPVNLDYQDFQKELAGLPGKYAADVGGAVFLAYSPTDGEPVGVVGVRNLPTEGSGVPICELKRLYLAPHARGKGVAHSLMDAVLARARELGYKEMLLDTLRSMTPARKLYEHYGFTEIPAYYTSVEGAMFYKLVL